MINYNREEKLSRIAAQVFSPYDSSGMQRMLFRSAKDCYIFGEDNRQYMDLINGKGSILIGHNNEHVNNAIIQMLQQNKSNYTGPNEMIISLANRITDSINVEQAKIAFFGTGTAACRAAVGATRSFTGEKMIVSSGYHGWDPMWDIWDKDVLEINNENMINFFFIPELLEKVIMEHKDKIALVIISPDYTYLKKETLFRIIDICRVNKLLICCDDVKQGFRYRDGSSLECVTNQAVDLYTFSKGLANGHRISCLAGRPDIMKYTKYYSFTSYYDMISISAALATLDFMKKNNAYEIITKRGYALLEKLKKICEGSRLPIEVNGSGPMFHLVFGTDELQTSFYREAINQGICFYEGDNQCISWSYNEDASVEFCRRFENVIDVVARKYSHIQNMDVSDERTFVSAWNMIDGAADNVPVEKRIELIRKYNLK